MSSVAALDRLTAVLAKLPGIGRRSAERMALRLVRDRDGVLRELESALHDAAESVRACSLCGSITVAGRDPCRLCTDPGRDDDVLCVVEDPNDIVMIERSGGFHGRYHVLHGKISPMKGMGADEIRLRSLVKRVKESSFKEVLLALSTDVEGDATASLIAECLYGCDVKTSRLAFGLPAGSGISYSDPVTLARAIRGRQDA